MEFFLYGIGVWFIILVLAVLSGTLRDFGYRRFVGELAAHQISSVLLSAVILVVTYLFLRIGNFQATPTQCVALGLVWLCMTVAFEFLFFHYVGGHPWSELLANYNLLAGRIWLLVLLTTTLAPWLMRKLL
jgi:HJR/Mrr/RecB family endonuclease